MKKVRTILSKRKIKTGGFYTRLMTPEEIIYAISMLDCTGNEFMVYDTSEFRNVEKLEVFGTCHNFENPLHIKVAHSNGNIAFDGYGQEH